MSKFSIVVRTLTDVASATAATTWFCAQEKCGPKALQSVPTDIGLVMIPLDILRLSLREADDPVQLRLTLADRALSGIGDVLLAKRQEIPGFLAFLAAQTIKSFIGGRRSKFGRNKLPFVLYGLAATGYTAWIWRKIEDPAMRPAALLYAGTISVAAAQFASAAMDADTGEQRLKWTLAAIGGGMQFVSDAVLGYNFFVKMLPHGEAIVMSTYWGGTVLQGEAI